MSLVPNRRYGRVVQSTEEVSGRWVTRGYAVRVVLALITATLLVGFVNGGSRALQSDGLIMLNGVTGEVPLFWYRVGNEVAGGLLLAALPSFLAVFHGLRPTPAAVIRRLLVGPLVAGFVVCGLSALWGWQLLYIAVAMTATACVGFVLVGVLFRLTEVPPAGTVTLSAGR
jgi:hypothetical protein